MSNKIESNDISPLVRQFWIFSEKLIPIPVDCKSNKGCRAVAFRGELSEFLETSFDDNEDEFIEELSDCFSAAAYFFHRFEVTNFETDKAMKPLRYMSCESKFHRHMTCGTITDDKYFEHIASMIPEVVNSLLMYRDDIVKRAFAKGIEKQTRLWCR